MNLVSSFYRLFVEQDGSNDIRAVITALEEGKPVLPFLEPDNGSLSTIFIPFHIRSSHPSHNVRAFLEHVQAPKQFYSFCTLAAEIEELTFDSAIWETEPPNDKKELLLVKLKEFMDILPTLDVFVKWCQMDQEDRS